ncbi:response regulator [Dongia sp.]|uniref:response regulator n=1 Tax=Dongia sp. TaxID=1977262 RepID=UPI0035B4CBC9
MLAMPANPPIAHAPAPQLPHLLIVDDDRDHRLLLGRLFGENGFRVSLAPDGATMLRLFEAAKPDLVILDLMLPDEDGLSLCRRIRAASDVPVIMVSALGRGPHKIAGLDTGADDYIAKPFESGELIARTRAVLRRSRRMLPVEQALPARKSQGRTYCFEGWRVDAARREVHSPEGVLVTLTSGEIDLLLAFAEHPQTILSREHLVELTRHRGGDGQDRSVDILVSRIRRKIERNPRAPRLIKTVRSGGYLFAPTVTLEE